MDDLLQMHGSSRQDPLLAGKLDSLIAESRGVKAASMSEITWRGRVIRVKNTKVSESIAISATFKKINAKSKQTIADANLVEIHFYCKIYFKIWCH